MDPNKLMSVATDLEVSVSDLYPEWREWNLLKIVPPGTEWRLLISGAAVASIKRLKKPKGSGKFEVKLLPFNAIVGCYATFEKAKKEAEAKTYYLLRKLLSHPFEKVFHELGCNLDWNANFHTSNGRLD